MKVLLVHYRYSTIGGPERYLFNLKKALEERGHDVIPFSVAYPENESCEYADYFVQPAEKKFHLHKTRAFSLNSFKVAKDMLYNKQAYTKLKILIEKEKPDIGYVLLYRGKLSHSIFDAFQAMKLPVLLRISSFSYFCGKATFFRNNKVCIACLEKPFSIVKKRCLHNSFLYSLLSYFINLSERRSNSLQKVREIICPSEFTASFFRKEVQSLKTKVTHLPTFFDLPEFVLEEEQVRKRFNSKKILYIGRVSEEKGVDTIISAINDLKSSNVRVKFIITGFSNTIYSKKLEDRINKSNLNSIVSCREFLNKEEVFDLINDSFLTLVPSVWYENMPNSLIESQAFGVPVITSDIGSLTELVTEGINGWKIFPGDSDNLKDKINEALRLDFESYNSLANNSYKWANEYCSKKKHVDKLIEIFKKNID